MPSIATIMGLTSYNPYKEAITMLVEGAGPYLINKLTLQPTSIVSKIDRIRETLFRVRTRFFEFTQKNTLTKHTWLFLKHVPISLAVSKGPSLFFYLIIKREKEMVVTENILILINCAKHLLFLLCLGVRIYDELNPLPPKARPSNEPKDWISRRHAHYSSYTEPSITSNYSRIGWKDYSRPSEFSGKKSPLTPLNPGGFKLF